MATGKIVQIQGVVVDVEFPPDGLPEIYNALSVTREGSDVPLILEVQQHLGNDWVRAVAMSTTDGLRRGAEAVDTGESIQVPVGPATLGRILNVLGEPVDNAGPVEHRDRVSDSPPSSVFRRAVDRGRGLRDRRQSYRPDRSVYPGW